jgi:hypothetical protein
MKFLCLEKNTKGMELGPRQVAFVMSEMERIEESDTRGPTEKVEATRIRKKAEAEITE